MKASFLVVFIFAALLHSTHARTYLTIDEFEIADPLILSASGGGDIVAPYDWWSPYYVDGSGSGGDPEASFTLSALAVGGQRDAVLGYESATPRGSVAVISIVQEAASVAFPLKYVGGAYFQWDGIDSGVITDPVEAFPGAIFHSLPGLGQGEADSDDNRTIDFTYGGRAAGLFIQITADHNVFYFLDCINTADVINTYAFEVEIVDEDSTVEFFIRFDDPIWDSPGFDFTDVAGFQVRIFTFNDGVLAGADNAIDTEFTLLRVLGFEASGFVFLDCLCDSTTDLSPVFEETINLFNFGSPVVIDTATTDINGFYIFDSQVLLRNTLSYTVCLDNQAQPLCPGGPTCLDFSIVDFTDVLELNFFLTAVSTLNIPIDVTVECDGCTDPGCTGFASIDGCGTGNVFLTADDFIDDFADFGCTSRISRTWTDPDTLESAVQTINIQDTLAPVILTPAVDSLDNDCLTPAETLAEWTGRFAGATASDCTGFVFTFPPVAIGPCNSVDVTFTASDPCGHSSPTTATYSTIDSLAPVYSVEPIDTAAECDLKTGSSDNAQQSWINANGFSVVSDNCASVGQLTLTNNYVGFQSSCSDTESVTFSVSDPCGNIVLGTASFTIQDNTDPTFLTLPTDIISECSSVPNSNDDDFRAWVAISGGASATDSCITDDANLLFTDNATAGVVGGVNTCSQVLSVDFTVFDNCGLFTVASATYTIEDTNPPFITANAVSLSVQCDGSGNASEFSAWIARNADAGIDDACDSSIAFSNNNSGPPENCGETVSVTFSGTDVCGVGTASTTASFTIFDNVAPFFLDFPQNLTSECDATTQGDFDLWLASNAGASVDDACSAVGLTISNNYSGAPIALTCSNAITVAFTAVDSCGSNTSAPEVATFTVVDSFDPTITDDARSQTVECDLTSNQADYAAWIARNADAIATDSCGGVFFTNDSAAIASGCFEVSTVIFTANDSCGNFAMTTASFTIQDTTSPTLVSSANDLQVECNGSGNTNDIANFLGSRAGFTLSDTCSVITYSDDFTEMSGGCVSTAAVTFTGCDSCLFCSSSDATLTISDTLGPSISPLASDTNIECDPAGNGNDFQNFLDNQGGAVAFDICDNADLVWSNTFVTAPAGCNSEVVTFTVTDACSQTAVTTATFTIFDSIAPAFAPPPSNLSVECDGFGNISEYSGWINTFGGAGATDACAIDLAFSSTAAAVGPVGCGSEIGSFTVQDECLNAVTANAVFSVVDTIAPVFSQNASDMTVECDISVNAQQLSDWLADNAGAIASDSCYGTNVNFSNNFVTLIPDACTSSATVEFVATDPCGESAVSTATFLVEDTIAPIITVPATFSAFECDSSTDADIANYVATRGSAQATDSCSFVTWSNDFVDTPLECSGPDFITFTATDVCGNFASTTGSVEIDDSIPPTFSNFPINRLILCDQSSDPSQTGSPLAGDACDASVDFDFVDVQTQEPDERLCPGDTIITRTWTAVDDCGNFFSQDQIISVTIPVGDCTFTPCPTCEFQICCESSIEPVACNPVSCNPVPCQTTSCGSVPCLPIVCGGNAVPIFDDDDDSIPVATVTAAPQAGDCDPIYIYVFDDDEVDNGDPVPYLVQDSSSSDASGLYVSFFVLLAALLVWM